MKKEDGGPCVFSRKWIVITPWYMRLLLFLFVRPSMLITPEGEITYKELFGVTYIEKVGPLIIRGMSIKGIFIDEHAETTIEDGNK